MIPLKQSTASQEIPLGPFLDNTDGDTEETGLTIANTDISLWKNGTTTLVNKNSGGATHISDGIYYVVLDATDTDTLGPMKGYVHITGALYVWETFLVMTAEAYETFINTGIWNHLLASHDIANTFGEKINDVGIASDLVDAILDEDITTHVIADSVAEEIQSHSTSTELSTHDGKLDTVDTVVDALPTINEIWDEPLTAATHNVVTSSGRRLRDIASNIVLTGTSPNTAGTANTSIRIELDSDASSVDGAYDPAIVVITGGTGIGQSRQIFEYDGTNKYAYINRTWKVIPDNTSVYTIVGDSGDTHVNEGLATGGGNTTITINALASAIDNTYVGQIVFLSAGTGEDQSRMITAYDGTTKVATLDRAWETNPVNGETIYAILPVTDLTVTTDKIDVIDVIVDAILLDTGTDGVVVAAGSKTGYALSAAGIEANWDEVLEGSLTARQFLRIVLSAVAGVTTDGGTRFRDEADAKNRIVAVTDASKNRTSMTLDGSD